jgi:hypothetical protein
MALLDTQVVSGIAPSPLSPAQIGREFRGLVDGGVPLRPAGSARANPAGLLTSGYLPKHRIQVFDTTLYLTNLRFDDDLGFFVAYVLPAADPTAVPRGCAIHPRIFYKDVSLVWRVATHYIRSDEDNWIGKGDLKCAVENGVEMEYSAEETTNLPLEIQGALDSVSRAVRHARRDDEAIELILRRAPDGRFEPYADFLGPRHRAMSDARNLIHRGRFVARFERQNDPASLRFVAGFEPDFDGGVVEISRSGSRMYGGKLHKFRILSLNGKIQYQFIAGPRRVWIVPPQTLTTELSTYGVRTVDVMTDEDLCVPGFEYHFIDENEDPPRLHSQIPTGFAGEASDVDPSRADASAWLDRLPVIREFRQKVLRRRRLDRALPE